MSDNKYIPKSDVKKFECRERYYKIKANEPGISSRRAADALGISYSTLAKWVREWDSETIPEVEELASKIASWSNDIIEALESLDTGATSLARERLMHLLDATEEASYALSQQFPSGIISSGKGGNN